jgi:hypothetical protein
MDRMVEDPEDKTGPHGADDGPPGADDEYPVLPPEPVLAKPTPAFYGPDPDELLQLEHEPEEEKEGFQFSLREMFAVMTVAAISLGIASSMPGGGVLRGILMVAGVGLFAGLVVLDYLRAKRRVLYIAWWTLFVSYLLIGLLAVAATF